MKIHWCYACTPNQLSSVNVADTIYWCSKQLCYRCSCTKATAVLRFSCTASLVFNFIISVHMSKESCGELSYCATIEWGRRLPVTKQHYITTSGLRYFNWHRRRRTGVSSKNTHDSSGLLKCSCKSWQYDSEHISTTSGSTEFRHHYFLSFTVSFWLWHVKVSSTGSLHLIWSRVIA